MKNLRLRQLRETSVLRLRLAYRVGEGGSSVTLVIGGKDSTDEGFCLERIRWVGGWWDCHPVSAVFIRIERVFTMTTERGGMVLQTSMLLRRGPFSGARRRCNTAAQSKRDMQSPGGEVGGTRHRLEQKIPLARVRQTLTTDHLWKDLATGFVESGATLLFSVLTLPLGPSCPCL